MKKDNIKTYGASVVGTSHLALSTECQDYCAHDTVDLHGQKYVISAIADGLGSCKFSAKGAKKAVESSIDFIKREITQDKDALNQSRCVELLNNAFEYARLAVEELADSEGSIVASYYSTLVVSIYDGDHLYYGNSGDSGLIALFADGNYELLTERKKGEEANSVIPLQLGEWEFNCTSNVVAIFMVTDGVLDVMAPEISSGVLIYWPFFEFLITDIHDNDTQEDLDEFIRNIADGNDLKKSVTDDITILVSFNTRKKFKTPVFVYEKYKQKIDTHKEQERKKLYSDSSHSVQKQNQNDSKLIFENSSSSQNSTQRNNENQSSIFNRTSDKIDDERSHDLQTNYSQGTPQSNMRTQTINGLPVVTSNTQSQTRTASNTNHGTAYSGNTSYSTTNSVTTDKKKADKKSTKKNVNQPILNLVKNPNGTIPNYLYNRMWTIKAISICINFVISFIMSRILFMLLNDRNQIQDYSWFESVLNNFYTGSQKVSYIIISIAFSIAFGLIVPTKFCKHYYASTGTDQEKASYMILWCIIIDAITIILMEVMLSALMTAIHTITMVLFFVIILSLLFLLLLSFLF